MFSSLQVFPSHFTQQRCKDPQLSSSSSELDSRLCSSSASTAGGGCRSGGGSQTNISGALHTPTSTHNSLSSCTGTPQSLGISTDFWDLLVKLDNMNVSRKGKASMKTVPLGASGEAEGAQLSLEASPLGQLMNMLSHPVIRRSSLLTEKLLRLLSLISIALPDNKATEVPAGHPVPQAAPAAQATAGSVGTVSSQGAAVGTVPTSQPASTATAATTTASAATGTTPGMRAIDMKFHLFFPIMINRKDAAKSVLNLVHDCFAYNQCYTSHQLILFQLMSLSLISLLHHFN